MLRSAIFAALVLIAAYCVRANAAHAAPISWNNPSRSFNVSGINYGSMQWEKKYGNRSSLLSRQSRKGLFMRRGWSRRR